MAIRRRLKGNPTGLTLKRANVEQSEPRFIARIAAILTWNANARCIKAPTRKAERITDSALA
jgi:hypothetical protein